MGSERNDDADEPLEGGEEGPRRPSTLRGFAAPRASEPAPARPSSVPPRGGTLTGLPAPKAPRDDLGFAGTIPAPAPEGGSMQQSKTPVFGRGRLTLSFRGPPLALPDDELESADAAPSEPEPLSLELDDDMRAPEPPPPEPEPFAEPEGPAPLDLDLSGLDPEGSAVTSSSALDGRDGWSLDRFARTKTPEAGTPVAPKRPSTHPPSRPPSRAKPWSEAPAPPPASISSKPPAAGDALGLVDRGRPPSGPVDFGDEMAERYALGDFTGALRVAELLLGKLPDDPEARRIAQASRERLEEIYSSRLAPLGRVPIVAVPDTEIRWLGLDHRAGFLLSRLDGTNSIEEILDISGMAKLETLKTLVDLLEAGVIRLE